MMMSLFSIFDPVTKIYSLNWFSILVGLLILPQSFWMFKSRFMFSLLTLMNFFYSESKVVVNNKFNSMNLLFCVSLFVFLLLNNFMGLFSYIFTSSSHLIFCLSMSLPIWLGLFMFGWIKNLQLMLIHLVPQGTPFGLMFFMVLIELLSNLIRPMTLAIRLTANMIAGHLLLTLLSSFIPDVLVFYMMVLGVQLMLLILEVSVSLIQAYVFVILLTLYIKEIN